MAVAPLHGEALRRRSHIMKLEHIGFNVTDSAAMADWYMAHLGLKLARRNDSFPHERFLVDDSGISVIELFSRTDLPTIDFSVFDPFVFHIAFTAVDIDAEKQRLIAAGGVQDGDLIVSPIGDLLQIVRCPWGFPIQLVTRATPILD